MEDAFVAVDPFLTAAGDLACLVQQLGEGKAQPVPKPAGLQLNSAPSRRRGQSGSGGEYLGRWNFQRQPGFF